MKKLHEAINELKHADPIIKPQLCYDPFRNNFFVSYYFSAAYIQAKGMLVYHTKLNK